ncbi:MAG: sugar ABC transporter permease [Promicromonosporaceae bacterium]|nr:sugar ABC transporter permease [Promicromonosporaceae bacterium]
MSTAAPPLTALEASRQPQPIRKRRRPIAPYLLIGAPIVVLLLGMGYPLFRQIVTSFQGFGLAQQFGADAEWVGLDNYVNVFTTPEALAVLWRSLAFMLVTSFLIVGIGLGIALLMRVVHGWVKVFLQVTLLLAWATPVIASVTVFRWLFDWNNGVVNWLLVRLGFDGMAGFAWFSTPFTFFVVAAVVIVWMGVPFVAMSLFAGLTQVPDEILEAARIDGASSTQILWRIIMPLVKPVLSIVLLLQFIWNLRVFAQIRLLQDGGAPVTDTNLLGNFIFQLGIGRQDFGGAAAVSLVVLLLTIVISAPYVRSIMKGDSK